MFSLKDKVALVTGASQGIGRDTALALTEAGAKVAVAARNEEKLTALVAEISASRVNAVAPGFIKTPMTDVLPDKVKEELNTRIPLGRMGSARDVAAAIVFLASDEAAYITGHVLDVNGGMYLA